MRRFATLVAPRTRTPVHEEHLLGRGHHRDRTRAGGLRVPRRLQRDPDFLRCPRCLLHYSWVGLDLPRQTAGMIRKLLGTFSSLAAASSRAARPISGSRRWRRVAPLVGG